MDVLLAETERRLRQYHPDSFGTDPFAAPECTHFVRQVEDAEAWRAGYPTLEAFYAAHEARHPCIRVYSIVDRERETENLTSPGGTFAERIARHCGR